MTGTKPVTKKDKPLLVIKLKSIKNKYNNVHEHVNSIPFGLYDKCQVNFQFLYRNLSVVICDAAAAQRLKNLRQSMSRLSVNC